MFLARLEECGSLKKMIEAIKDTVTNANIDINEEGLSLQAMDSSRVSLVWLLIKSTGFSRFKFQKSFTFGINLVSLNKVLKCATSDDSITLSCDENIEKLDITFESLINDRISIFRINLIQINYERLEIPETNYMATISLTSTEYRRICTDMSFLGDTLNIEISKENLIFEIDGDIGKGRIVFQKSTASKNKEDVKNFSTVETISSSFALRYLTNFAKATPLCEIVLIKISKDLPIQVEFGVNEIGFLRYYLAPKLFEHN